jgi:hypothetical protein
VIYGRERLRWDDSVLRLDGKGRAILQIGSDGRYPDMWRIRLPGGGQSEMANWTRVRDAAVSHALATLNGQNKRQETSAQAPAIRSRRSRGPQGRKAA